MKINRFEDLSIWKDGMQLSKIVFDVTSRSKFKDYSLKDQIRRSIISVTSNIAEGFERNNNKEFIRFLIIAKASCGEARSQIFLAKMLEYISEEEYQDISQRMEEESKSIAGFVRYLRKLGKIER